MHWRLHALRRAASEPLLYTLLGRTAAERRPGPTPRAQLAHVGLPAPLPREGAHLFLTGVPTSVSFPLPCSQSPGRTARKKPSGGTTVPKYTAGSGAGVLHAAGTPGVCSGTVPWGQHACQAKPSCRRQQIQAGREGSPPRPPHPDFPPSWPRPTVPCPSPLRVGVRAVVSCIHRHLCSSPVLCSDRRQTASECACGQLRCEYPSEPNVLVTKCLR